jgi:Ca-activated chloride channel family protein
MRMSRSIAAALALVAVVFAPVAGTSAAQGDVRFVAPRPRSTALGETQVEVVVTPPEGAEVANLIVRVDGEPLATLSRPPWTLTWDAGDGARSRLLEAVATFTDGTRAQATVRTSRLRINAVEEVDLVNLYAVVRDGRGRYVEGLTADDFRLLEDGREQTIKIFTAEPKPLVISIVLDVSTTMEGRKLASAKESAVAFLRALLPRDRAMVLGFSDRVRVLQDLTDDQDALRAAIEGVEARGGTALYDAIWKGSEALRAEDARRVMILLSDGRDEAANGLEPGSLHTMQEALDHALRCEVMVFAIGFGRESDLAKLDFFERYSQADILTRFGEATGGSVLFPRKSATLRKAFEDVALDLRNQYAVAYSPDNEARDGRWREIRLIPLRDDLEVVTRSGYFAAGSAD